mgnify:CR=1 FL=1
MNTSQNRFLFTGCSCLLVMIAILIAILVGLGGYAVGRITTDPTPTATTAPTATATEPVVVSTIQKDTVEVPPTATSRPYTVQVEPSVQEVAVPPETCGLIFPAYSRGKRAPLYDVHVDCWEDASGSHLRGWQKSLPPATDRVAHSVAIVIPRGQYVFNGVLCRLHLDEEHNGKGASNPVVAANGNNLPFNVDVDVAWALVECSGGPSSGFDYWSR